MAPSPSEAAASSSRPSPPPEASNDASPSPLLRGSPRRECDDDAKVCRGDVEHDPGLGRDDGQTAVSVPIESSKKRATDVRSSGASADDGGGASSVSEAAGGTETTARLLRAASTSTDVDVVASEQPSASAPAPDAAVLTVPAPVQFASPAPDAPGGSRDAPEGGPLDVEGDEGSGISGGGATTIEEKARRGSTMPMPSSEAKSETHQSSSPRVGAAERDARMDITGTGTPEEPISTSEEDPMTVNSTSVAASHGDGDNAIASGARASEGVPPLGKDGGGDGHTSCGERKSPADADGSATLGEKSSVSISASMMPIPPEPCEMRSSSLPGPRECDERMDVHVTSKERMKSAANATSQTASFGGDDMPIGCSEDNIAGEVATSTDATDALGCDVASESEGDVQQRRTHQKKVPVDGTASPLGKESVSASTMPTPTPSQSEMRSSSLSGTPECDATVDVPSEDRMTSNSTSGATSRRDHIASDPSLPTIAVEPAVSTAAADAPERGDASDKVPLDGKTHGERKPPVDGTVALGEESTPPPREETESSSPPRETRECGAGVDDEVAEASMATDATTSEVGTIAPHVLQRARREVRTVSTSDNGDASASVPPSASEGGTGPGTPSHRDRIGMQDRADGKPSTIELKLGASSGSAPPPVPPPCRAKSDPPPPKGDLAISSTLPTSASPSVPYPSPASRGEESSPIAPRGDDEASSKTFLHGDTEHKLERVGLRETESRNVPVPRPRPFENAKVQNGSPPTSQSRGPTGIPSPLVSVLGGEVDWTPPLNPKGEGTTAAEIPRRRASKDDPQKPGTGPSPIPAEASDRPSDHGDGSHVASTSSSSSPPSSATKTVTPSPRHVQSKAPSSAPVASTPTPTPPVPVAGGPSVEGGEEEEEEETLLGTTSSPTLRTAVGKSSRDGGVVKLPREEDEAEAMDKDKDGDGDGDGDGDEVIEVVNPADAAEHAERRRKRCPHVETDGGKSTTAPGSSSKEKEAAPSKSTAAAVPRRLCAKLLEGEYEVRVPLTDEGLLLVIKEDREGGAGLPMFEGYRDFSTGEPGPAKRMGLIRNRGDRILAVEGVSTLGLRFEDATELLRRSVREARDEGRGGVTFRFLERPLPPSGASSDPESESGGTRPLPPGVAPDKSSRTGDVLDAKPVGGDGGRRSLDAAENVESSRPLHGRKRRHLSPKTAAASSPRHQLPRVEIGGGAVLSLDVDISDEEGKNRPRSCGKRKREEEEVVDLESGDDDDDDDDAHLAQHASGACGEGGADRRGLHHRPSCRGSEYREWTPRAPFLTRHVPMDERYTITIAAPPTIHWDEEDDPSFLFGGLVFFGGDDDGYWSSDYDYDEDLDDGEDLVDLTGRCRRGAAAGRRETGRGGRSRSIVDNSVRVSPDSPALRLADGARYAAAMRLEELKVDGHADYSAAPDVGGSHDGQEWRSLDEFLDASSPRYASSSDRDLLKACVVGAVTAGDVVESIRCKHGSVNLGRSGRRQGVKRAMPGGRAAYASRLVLLDYASCSPSSSDLYVDPLERCLDTLEDDANYPLQITFLRRATGGSGTDGGDCSSGNCFSAAGTGNLGRNQSREKVGNQAKKQKVVHILDDAPQVKVKEAAAPEKHGGGKNKSGGAISSVSNTSETAICILDSSDEEDAPPSGDVAERDVCAVESNGYMTDEDSGTDAMEIDEEIELDPLGIIRTHPDPCPAYDVDDFVIIDGIDLPGRIISHRIERIATRWSVGPIVVYTVNVGFGHCHARQSSVRLLNRHSRNRVILTYAGVAITEMDKMRLWPETYLNDSLINFYIKFLLRHNIDGRGRKECLSLFHVFSTYFYSRISFLEGGTSAYRNTKEHRRRMYNDLKGWSKGVDIFQKRFLVIPVNYDLHWTFVLVCNPGDALDEDRAESSSSCPASKDVKPPSTTNDVNDEKNKEHTKVVDASPPASCDAATPVAERGDGIASCMLLLDSGKQFKLHRSQTIFSVLRKYLTACHEAKRERSDESSKETKPTNEIVVDDTGASSPPPPPSPMRFTAKNMPGFSPIVPAQKNTKDCGVYMLEMMERLLSDPPCVDADFVNALATKKQGPPVHHFSATWFGQDLIDQKRLRMLALIYELAEQATPQLISLC